MNKMKIMALSACIALGMAACSNEDNTVEPATVEQTVTIGQEEQTQVLTLKGAIGQPVILEYDTSEVGWIDAKALHHSGQDSAQVEVTVKKNDTEKVRTANFKIRVYQTTVFLTVNQGASFINDPQESVTDQPAYAPGL